MWKRGMHIESRCLGKPEEGVKSPVAGVTGCYDPPDMGYGI